jgi:PHP domain
MRAKLDFDGFAGAGATEHPYHYVPFGVPLHCSRIDVSYQYAAVHGDAPCTVDIGIFDIRGTEPFTGGFRGWSGSDRRTFFIERERATPGYAAGALPAGTWSLLLGLYEIPPAGVRWWITVEMEFAASAITEESRLSEAEAALPVGVTTPGVRGTESGWYRGDLHSHSEHSDGANTIREMADFAHSIGLEFLAITDHNTTTHHAEMAATESPVLLVPGEEVTTYKGHANVWGLREWVDFRVTTDDEMQRVLRWVEARQRPMSMNHPKTHGPPWELADPGFGVREVWQAPWRWYNWQSVRAWDEALTAGRRIVQVGGSDAHWVPPAEQRHPNTVGDPTTWLYCEGGLSEESVLAAITSGRTAISDGPAGPMLTLEASDDGEGVVARHVRAGGCDLVFVADGEPRRRVTLQAGDGVAALPREVRFDRYLRAELRIEAPKGREDVRALSAPLYRD